MEVIDVVREWSKRCAQCSTCKVFHLLYLPACPPGFKYKFKSYYATGRMMIGNGLADGSLSIEDDDILERIYTCTACKACDENCPNKISGHLVDVIQGIRQMVVSAGCTLPAHQIMVESLKKNDNVLEKPKEERGEWAQGLGLKNITTEKADILFRAGCLLSFNEELREVIHCTIHLLQSAGADIGIEGNDEVCCGGRAHDIGLMSEFTKYAENNIDAYNNAGVKKVVVSCADGLSHMKLLYPKVNKEMNFEVLHTVEYLDEAIKAGKIRFTKNVPMKVTYHDPCHLGRYNGIFEPPRDILKSIPGLELVEMERNREKSWCCGAGAGVKQAYPDFSLWTALERIKEAKGTGATALVTTCPWCNRNFKDAIKQTGEKFEVYDIAELACKAL